MVDIRTSRGDHEDFDRVLAFANQLSAPQHAMTESGLRSFLTEPGFEPRTDLFLATDPASLTLVGARDVRVTARGDENPLILESWGGVATGEEAGTVSDALLSAAEARARQLVSERGRRRCVMQVRCNDSDLEIASSFERCGFRFARPLVTMICTNVEDLAEPRVPAGITVRRYEAGRDAEAWVTAFNDAFSDHWGGFMGMNVPRWRHFVAESSFDPTISLVALDGDVIAGFCHGKIDAGLNEVNQRNVGMIRYVGVRPGWRGKGLGAALTRMGMVALRNAGVTSIALGVDAENVTGARQLYERLGFGVVGCQSMYRKEFSTT